MKFSICLLALFALMSSSISFARDIEDGYVVSHSIHDDVVAVFSVDGFKVRQKSDPSEHSSFAKLRGELRMTIEGNICMAEHVISDFESERDWDRKDGTYESRTILTLKSVGRTLQSSDGCTQHGIEAKVIVPLQVSALVGPKERSSYQRSIHKFFVPTGYPDKDKKRDGVMFTISYELGKGWSVSEPKVIKH